MRLGCFGRSVDISERRVYCRLSLFTLLPRPFDPFRSCPRVVNRGQELDFLNEANNQIRMKRVLSDMAGQVFVPDVMLELSTRRVLVSEWVDGVKLTKADPAVVGWCYGCDSHTSFRVRILAPAISCAFLRLS